MKTKQWVRFLLALLCLDWEGTRLFAGNGTWQNTGSTNANWNTSSNWVSGTIPGATSGTTNTDVAVFNTPLGSFGTSGSPILIDSTTENIGGITFSGASGSFTVGSASGSNSFLLTSGGTIQISSSLSSTNAIENFNAPLIIEGSNGTYTLSNNSANGSGAGAGTLNFVGGITGGASGATVLTLGGSNTNSNTLSGIIGNGSATSLGITENGTGTWVLSGANTFTGALNIQSGTLVASTSATALGTGTVTLGLGSSSNSATLMAGGATTGLTYVNSIVLASGDSGTLTIGNNAGTGISSIFSGGITGTNNLVLNNSGAGTITLSGTVNNAGTITNSGTASTGNIFTTGSALPAGSVNISKALGANVTAIVENGPSDLVLGGNSGSLTFTTTINSGRIDISNYGNGASSPFSKTIGVSIAATSGNTAILNYAADLSRGNGFNANVGGPISVSGAGTDYITATDWAPTYTGAVTLSANLNIAGLNGGSSTETFTGGVSGTGNITVYNDMANANSTVSFQTVAVNNIGTITYSNASVLGGTAGTNTGAANTITGGVGSNVTGIINDSTSALTISGGGVALNSGVTTFVEGPTGSGAGTAGIFTISSIISGTSGATVTNNGTNPVIFSGANTYSGGTTLTGTGTGGLQAGIASTTSGSGSSETITNGAFGTGLLTNNGGIVDLNGNSVAVSGLSGTGGTIGNSSTTAASSLTLVASGSTTYSGVIADSIGSGTKTTSLTIVGTGTQTLAGANTYSGATTINSGTLIVGNGTTGSLNNTSAINVSGGSLLFNKGATFNTSAIVTTNGTSTTPGVVGYTNSSSNSGATVTLGALSLTASSVTAIDFGTANTNTIVFTQGTAAIGLTGSTVLDVYHYVAGDNLEFSGSATPNSNDLFTNVQFFSGAVGSSTSMGSGQEVAFGGGYEIVPTPEPSTIVVGLGLVGLLMRRIATSIYRQNGGFLAYGRSVVL